MEKKSVIFIGTGEFGVHTLNELSKNGNFNIPFVITGLDKQAGRKMQMHFSPIKEAAIKNKLIVQQAPRIVELKQTIIQAKPDYLLVVAYGEIIPKEILEIPKIASINIHPSLLPKYRGASPIQETILNGDKYTGISWIIMNRKMDCGDIISQIKVDVQSKDTSETLSDLLSKLSSIHTPKVLMNFIQNRATEKQDESQSSYCKKISKNAGQINVSEENAVSIIRKIKAYSVWPTCYIVWNNKRLKIIRATEVEQKINTGEIVVTENKELLIGTKNGTIKPTIVQPESKLPMETKKFLLGQKQIPKIL